MKNRWIILVILLGMIASAGCVPNAIEDTQPSDISTLDPNSSGDEIATPDRIHPTVTKMPERVPPTEATTPITGEAPAELLDSIKKDLTERTGSALEQIVVIQDQEIVWNDGSLGCAQPGVFYTQALVNGYWVILEVDGKKYDYRVAASGYFFICDRGIPPGAPSTPNS